MKVYNVSNNLPQSQQNFGKASFYRMPDELKQVMLNDTDFDYFSKINDVEVMATPKATWKDPLRFRTAKVDEKACLTCVVMSEDYSFSTIDVATDKKLMAPLNEQVQTLLKTIKKLALEERLKRMF